MDITCFNISLLVAMLGVSLVMIKGGRAEADKAFTTAIQEARHNFSYDQVVRWPASYPKTKYNQKIRRDVRDSQNCHDVLNCISDLFWTHLHDLIGDAVRQAEESRIL